MIAVKVRRLAREATRRFRHRKLEVATDLHDQDSQDRIVELLSTLPAGANSLAIRDIHKALSTGQPIVLRALRELTKAERVSIEPVSHDPLASRVSLRR